MQVDNRMPGPRFRPSPEVIAQSLGGELVLLHLGTERFYELNPTTARLWELLCAGHDAAQIREQLLREFEVDPEQLAGEVRAILASLRDEDLVHAGA